jgi:chromosome segregation ATPase
MDFSKFDLLENKVTALIEKVTEAETVKAELNNKITEAEAKADALNKKLSDAEESVKNLRKKLADTEEALTKSKDDLNKSLKNNEALAEIQESAKSKIEDLIKDRQVALTRVDTLLEKLGSWT